MSATDIDILLIKHLADIDDGAKRMKVLEAKIASEMDAICNQWAKSKRWVNWSSWNDDELSVTPRKWVNGDPNDEDNWNAGFSLDYGYNDTGKGVGEEDCFWLTRLCGAGRGKIGFRFWQKVVPKSGWKPVARKHAPKLSKSHFILDEGTNFFFPVRVDSAALGEAVADGRIEEGLQTFEAALDHLVACHRMFDSIMRAGEKAAGRRTG